MEELMRQYGNDVLRMAYLYVKDIQIAEDMFQEVFLKVYEKLPSFEGRSDIKTWILRITMNTCKDFLKSAYHTRVVPMQEMMERAHGGEASGGTGHIREEKGYRPIGVENRDGTEAYEKIEQEETAQTVREAVGKLPEHYRDVVLCVYFQDMSMEAAASTLGIEVGTVKSRLARAREKLKKMLEGRVF